MLRDRLGHAAHIHVPVLFEQRNRRVAIQHVSLKYEKHKVLLQTHNNGLRISRTNPICGLFSGKVENAAVVWAPFHGTYIGRIESI